MEARREDACLLHIALLHFTQAMVLRIFTVTMAACLFT